MARVKVGGEKVLLVEKVGGRGKQRKRREVRVTTPLKKWEADRRSHALQKLMGRERKV